MAFESLLNSQIEDIIASHLNELQVYLPNTAYQIHVPTDLTQVVMRLDRLIGVPAEYSTRPQQEEVFDLLGRLECFLRQMNVVTDEHFAETLIGRIWSRAHHWQTMVMGEFISPPIHQVWELLKPAVPDVLEKATEGYYVAKWWKPYPVMDVEILLRTDGIRIHGDPFQPEDLASGVAVCFWVI